MKKIATRLLSALICAGMLAGCSSGGGTQQPAASATPSSAAPAAASGAKTNVTILMGKPEVGSQFEEMLANYNKNNPNVNITMIPLAGQDAYEKMTSLYSSGNAPSILMVGQEFDEFKDKFLDLSETLPAKNANDGTMDFVTVDGKVYGIPTTVEAYGIIYNKDVINKTLGADYDMKKINTRDGLKAAFDALKEKGVEPFTLSPMDWSLGAHLSNSIFTNQGKTYEERHKFLDDLKAGKVDLASNQVFNGFMDTFDLLIEYNMSKAAPLAPVYEDSMLHLGMGEAAMWFMGNWAYPQLKEVSDVDYEFVPVVISNNPSDNGNNSIAVGVPSYWCVDKSANTKEQQDAAVKFLEWFTTTPEGQDYYVNKLNFIPAYKEFKVSPADSMSRQMVKFMEDGKTLEWVNLYYPAGGFQKMGASMQKYIDKKIDRAGLAKEIQDYWASVGK